MDYPPRLSDAEVRDLVTRMHAGDQAARNRLAEEVDGWARKWGLAYARRKGVDVDDVIQDCRLRLLEELPKFDPDIAKLTTWAPFVWKTAMTIRHGSTGKPGSEAVHAPRGASLDRDLGDGFTLGDLLAAPGDPYAEATSRLELEFLAPQLEALKPLWRHVIQRLYLDNDQPKMAQVGRELGVSRERVRQLRDLALNKLRATAPDCFWLP
jgi:RNA polymerase sigma factor (sigma-70 family)